jgi:hypothetical protein
MGNERIEGGAGMQNEECRTGLPLRPKPVGCPVEPAFCVGPNHEAKESGTFAQRNRKELGQSGKTMGAPFLKKYQ